MKEITKILIAFALGILICLGTILIFLSMCFSFEMEALGIWAKKSNEIPDTYVNMSEQQMAGFPHLKEAILLGNITKTPKEEYDCLHAFLEEHDTWHIKYQGEYYLVTFVTP